MKNVRVRTEISDVLSNNALRNFGTAVNAAYIIVVDV